jgi:hypothetical protein
LDCRDKEKGGNIMQKTIAKAVCVFTLVFFVMSLTGAASPNTCKTDAKNDSFTLNYCNLNKHFNVLVNDNGCNLKVTPAGNINTAKGGIVKMSSSGIFYYTKPVACSEKIDSFTYTVVGKDKMTDTATVTVKLKCTSCSNCPKGNCPG